jgi:hypothetical protein
MHTLVENFGLYGHPYVLFPVRDGATYSVTYCSSGTYARSFLGTAEFLVALDAWVLHPCLISAFIYRLHDVPSPVIIFSTDSFSFATDHMTLRTGLRPNHKPHGG